MKYHFVFLLCLACSQSGLSQNAGGMINRPQKNRKTNKSGIVVAKKQSDNRFVKTFTRYDFAGDFSEGFAEVKLNGKYGFIDKTGREVIPCKYDDAESFHEGFAAVKLNGKYGFIDKTGREVIPCKYDYTFKFSEGFAAVELNGKYGFIDKKGKPLLINQRVSS